MKSFYLVFFILVVPAYLWGRNNKRFDPFYENGSSGRHTIPEERNKFSPLFIATEPTVPATAVSFSNITATGFRVHWVQGDGTASLVVIREDAAVNGVPTDGTSYSANAAFGSGAQAGAGNYVVYRATLSSISVTGLSEGHTYHVSVFTFNGTAGTGLENYLTLSPATGSQLAWTPSYYSQASGDPSLLANWNSLRAGGGSSPASLADGNLVIQQGHTITTTATVSIGATGYKLQVENGGYLVADHAITIGSGATFRIDSGGTYIHNNVAAYGATIFAGTESFAAYSNFELRNSNTAGPGGSFGNLTVNILSDPGGGVQSSAGITAVHGDFTMKAMWPGRELRLSGSTAMALVIDGDLHMISGVLETASGTGSGVTRTVAIGGNLQIEGGTLQCAGSNNPLTLSFTGAASRLLHTGGTLSGTNINWSIIDGASLLLEANLPVATGRTLTVSGIFQTAGFAVTGAGNFLLQASGELSVSNPTGMPGAVTVTGTKTFSSAATYSFVTGCESTGIFTTQPDAGTVGKLTLNTSGVVQLDQDLAVSGILKVINGRLALGSHNLVVGAVTGGTTSAYVQTSGTGSLVQAVSAATVLFPVGNSRYNPLSIGTGDGLYWSVNILDTVQNVLAPLNTDRAILRTWKITPAGSPLGATLTFQYDDSDPLQKGAGFLTGESVKLWHYTGASWQSASLALSPTGPQIGGTRTVTVSGITQFSSFALSNISGALPLQLLSFEGRRSREGAVLEWTVATGEPGSFIPERSFDGKRFFALGSVPGQAATTHNFVDTLSSAAALYYRLRLRGSDGQPAFSRIIKIDALGKYPGMLYPNPASEMVTIETGIQPGPAYISLFDGSGAKVVFKYGESSATRQVLDVSGLKAGSYFIIMHTGGRIVFEGPFIKR